MFNLPNIKLVILDFFCDNGALTYELARYNSLWTVLGYDTLEKTEKCLSYYINQYPNELEPPNAYIVNDEEQITQGHFDVVFYRNNKPNIKASMFIDVGE